MRWGSGWAATACALVLATASVAAGAAERPVLVGIDHDYPPYEFVDSDGRPTGFAVELFRAVADAEGIEFELRAGPWAEIRRDLERGALDVVVGMVRTEERARLLDFTIPTLLVEHAAFVRSESGFTTPRQLLGHSVVVEEGKLWDDELTVLAEQHELRLTRVPTSHDALRALVAGRFDAAVMPELQGLYLLRELGSADVHTVGFALDAEPFRFAVPTGRAALLARLNEGLALVRTTGTYDTLHDAWFGVLKPEPLSAQFRRAILLAGAGLAVLLLAALAWSASLRQTVVARGRQLLVSERARQDAEDEKQALERQLAQTQRMEALGRMAGAVAHDFNNVLTTILGSASLARDAAPGAKVGGFLDRIEQAGQVAADLTRQLLAFCRGQVTQPEILTWNETIERVREVLRGSVSGGRSLVFDLDPDPWPILLDRAQASQVVLNLVLNARDAIGPSGTIRVTTDGETRDGDAFACLIVRDDGAGMNDETRERIFEPYFTTKTAGRGTGLGLATTYGIVTKAGGTIDVESSPGAGTTFRVRMPRAAADAQPEAPLLPTPSGSVNEPRVVLLVDDDADVRRVGSEMLAALGYDAIAVGDAEEAMQILRRRPGIAVVLTDVMLPGMDGLELARKVVEEHPRVRILVTSGFMGSGPPPGGGGAISFVAKPFDRAALEAALAKVLSGAAARAEMR